MMKGGFYQEGLHDTIKFLSYNVIRLTMTEVKVHEKYLVVIPKDVRKALGINIGETVEFVIEKGRAVLYPHRGSTQSVKRVHGIIRHEGTIDEGIEEGYAAMGAE
ncbi:MAG: AbrB/MazE/SpoVT family DNA-binding domain-containing protein [Candidatus Methanoperedens sp.]|nr:MAG: AbrB/MazE/SpoVT family DNA-binding domain-containing protein [Candidatus Methanoperedens sp.]